MLVLIVFVQMVQSAGDALVRRQALLESRLAQADVLGTGGLEAHSFTPDEARQVRELRAEPVAPAGARSRVTSSADAGMGDGALRVAEVGADLLARVAHDLDALSAVEARCAAGGELLVPREWDVDDAAPVAAAAPSIPALIARRGAGMLGIGLTLVILGLGILVALWMGNALSLFKFILAITVTWGAPILLIFQWRRLTRAAVIGELAKDYVNASQIGRAHV